MPCFKFFTGRNSKSNSQTSCCEQSEEERGMNDGNPYDMSHLPPKKCASKASVKHLARLFKELECPVCYNTCVPPIETCKNGHIICVNCRAHMANCPTCREKFTGTRNFFAENFINQYAQHCRFREDGCEYLRWKGENMAPHETTCQFRHIQCIVHTCNKSLAYRNLLEHLVDEHRIAGTDTLPTWISYDVVDPIVASRKWLPYFIHSHENTFYVMMEVNRPCFYIWVWIQEKKREPNNNNEFMFVSTIRFQSGEKTMCHNWEGPVHSIRTPACQIKQEGLCLIIPESVMQHFEQDSRISMLLNIEKRKAPITPSPTPMQKTESLNSLPGDVLNITPPSENPQFHGHHRHHPRLNFFSGDSFNAATKNLTITGPYHSPR